MAAGMKRTPSVAVAGPAITAVEAEILRLTTARGPSGSIDPSEVAHALVPGDDAQWRSKLSAVRRAAIALARAGQIDILRKGRTVDPAEEIRGVIRLRVRPGAEPAVAEAGLG